MPPKLVVLGETYLYNNLGDFTKKMHLLGVYLTVKNLWGDTEDYWPNLCCTFTVHLLLCCTLLYIIFEYFRLAENLAIRCCYWLGRQGSNLRITGSKPDALPLGYAPKQPVVVAFNSSWAVKNCKRIYD